jgi:hypothetical protein
MEYALAAILGGFLIGVCLERVRTLFSPPQK